MSYHSLCIKIQDTKLCICAHLCDFASTLKLSTLVLGNSEGLTEDVGKLRNKHIASINIILQYGKHI